MHRRPDARGPVISTPVANLGISRLLFDLYGVPKGTTGYCAGLSLLGLE